MTAILPETLYRTKRGPCPGSGAPLDLDAGAPTTRCGFCGGEAVLGRRLREGVGHSPSDRSADPYAGRVLRNQC